MHTGYSEGFSDRIGDGKLDGAAPGRILGSESGTEIGVFDLIPGGKNSVKLEISPLVHYLGPGSGPVGVYYDDSSSNEF